ncbi:MAG: polysaccharide deacetylase family protein [Clostridia bacterium]
MKIVFIKKATVIFLVSLLVFVSAVILNVNGLEVGAVHFIIDRKLPIYSVDTEDDKVAISFDAAWGADKTVDIMNMCDEYNVKATFFLVGFWIEKYPDMVRTIYNRGFEIGIHSNTHPDMTKLSKLEIREELTTNIKLVEDITGTKPKLFRPPYGYYNNALIEICEELDLVCIEWSVDSLDWKGLSASEIAGRIIDRSTNGSIILCHNNSDHIVEALRLVYEYFNSKEIKVIPIGELIYYENYKIDNQGKQIKL